MPPEAVVQKWKAVYERGTIFVINRRANHSTMPMSVRVTQQKFRVFLPQEALGSDKPRPDDVTAEGIQEFQHHSATCRLERGSRQYETAIILLSDWGVLFK